MIARSSLSPTGVGISLCARSRARAVCASNGSETLPLPKTHESLKSRRTPLLSFVGIAASEVLLTSSAKAAKLPRGFTIVEDMGDGYKFLAPFGWQEVEVAGLDVVYKDLIEPLESVSVSLISTDKKSIKDFGPVMEVAYTLADKVLTPSDQKIKIMDASERKVVDTDYYQFEFETKAPNYNRHALGVVAVDNGTFYALTTGASERRWARMEDRLRTVIKSFQVTDKVIQ